MDQNQNQKQDYINYFKIPQFKNKKEQSHLIALLDSSYSMSGYWKYLSNVWNTYISQVQNKTLLTFSNQAISYGNHNEMTQSINLYNPGGTDIAKGFNLLNNTFQDIIEENITVLFVSDGQDSYNNVEYIIQLVQQNLPIKQKKVNFITVGVGSGFPTFLAMELRSIYHNGEENIPSLYLIDKCNDEKCWLDQFQMIQQNLDHKEELKFVQELQIFPWSEMKKQSFENIWVLSYSDILSIENDKNPIQKTGLPTVDQMTEIIQQWLNNLQLLSLKKINCQDAAQQCLNLINNWQQNQQSQGSQCQKGNKKQTFYQKMLKKQQNKDQSGLNILIKELKSIKQGNILNNLSESEAAKRLAIGTQIGKYHSKALELKGLSVEEYIQARNQFIIIYNENIQKISTDSEQEGSIISLQNQKEVFLEDDFIKGLEICESQYDLVGSLPLIGHGIYIKRFDGSMIDPYQITVSSVARHHKIIDSTALLGNQNNELILKTGNNEEEIINAVVPLFGDKDADLTPILTSKLYQILMTFNVMQNVDTLFLNAYQAVLANTCLYMVLQDKSQWQQDILSQIHKTLKITYAGYKGFQKYAQCLIGDTNMALVSEHPDCPYKCEDISKVLMILDYLKQEQQLEGEEGQKQIEKILKQIFQEFIGRNIPGEANLKDFFKIPNKEEFYNIDLSIVQNEIIQKLSQNLNQFYIESDVIKAIKTEIQDQNIKDLFQKNTQVELNKENLKFLNFGKSSLDNLRKIQKYYLNTEQDLLSESNLIIWLNHGVNYHSSMERNKNSLDKDVLNIKAKITEQLTKELIDQQLQEFQQNVTQILILKYQDIQNEIHQYCRPFKNQQELENVLKELNIKQNNEVEDEIILINQVNCLPIQACSAPKCQFFLQKNKQFPSHLQSTIPIPAFNKACVNTKKLDPLEVYDEIINGDHYNKNLSKFVLPLNNSFTKPENKDKVLEVIKQTLKDLDKI